MLLGALGAGLYGDHPGFKSNGLEDLPQMVTSWKRSAEPAGTPSNCSGMWCLGTLLVLLVSAGLL